MAAVSVHSLWILVPGLDFRFGKSSLRSKFSNNMKANTRLYCAEYMGMAPGCQGYSEDSIERDRGTALRFD